MADDIDAIRETLQSWLRSKGFDYKCLVCRSSTWQSGPRLALREVDADGHILQGPYMGIVPLVCLHCGHTLLFDVKPMGLSPIPENKHG